MPEAAPQSLAERYAIPQFVIPEDKIVTLGGSASEPKPAVPEKPAADAAPAAKPAETSEQATETTEPEKKAGEVQQETKAEPEAETTEKDPERRSSRSYERRIDRVTKQKFEALARAEAEAKRAAELQAKLDALSQPKPADGAPRMEDYTDVAEYAKAVAAHEVKLDRDKREREAREATVQQELKTMVTRYEENVGKAIDKYPDYDEVVGDLKPGLTPWGDAIMLAENGADIAYHLGKNEKEAERIMSLPPRLQFVEIGKLSAKLALQPETPKKPSKAPAPIVPVSTPSAVPPQEIRPQMPFEEYMQIGNKMFRGRR